MGLKDELEKHVSAIYKAKWDERDGNVVPDDDSLTLGNDAVKLKATVLYADLADSTKLVDGHAAFFSAEMYKTFLHCAAKIIREEDGVITAYDGDRIMAVYIGDTKNTRAVRSAMKVQFAVLHIINPAQQAFYTKSDFTMKHVVGVDTSESRRKTQQHQRAALCDVHQLSYLRKYALDRQRNEWCRYVAGTYLAREDGLSVFLVLACAEWVKAFDKGHYHA